MDAIEELKIMVSECVKIGDERGVYYFWGNDWFQLSDEEESIFLLAHAEMNLLTTVYDFYDGVLGICICKEFMGKKELFAAVRQSLPWLHPEMHSVSNFIKFADIFGVTPNKAGGMYYKNMFWQYRNGIMNF